MKKLLLIISILLTPVYCNGQLIDDWRTSGITTVSGTINNYEKYYKEFNQVEIQVLDWTNAGRRTYFSQIDSKGNFSLSFFIFNSQHVIFFYKNNWLGIFLSPNDTLKLNINADTFSNGIEYVGKTASLTKTMNVFSDSVYQQIFKESASRLNLRLMDSLNFAGYKNWRDSIYKLEMNRIQSYIDNTKPDTYLKHYFTSYVQLRYYRDFLSIRHKNDSRNSDERLADILSQIHSINTDTLHYDLRLSPSYSSVVNSLYLNISQIAVIYRSKVQSPRPQNSDIERISTKKDPSDDRTNLYKDIFYLYAVKAANVINNIQLRESVLAHFYSKVLEQNIDLGIDSALMLISDPEIKASLVNTYNSYQLRKSNQNSLKVNFDKSNILDNLKDKYKGYVLYIDIWGTWCGPCYESFKNAPAIKKAFENRKVAFIYLCSTCNKEKWEKDIKEYNLDGENIFLTSEQNATLSKDLNILGVPRYIIIDKNGKIVNDNAMRPSQTTSMQKTLIDELTKYLN